ncbi:MAG: sugar phosphate nucleotidyltransferase [bacterium]
MRIAVLRAGGSGKRFWPLGREARPKQVLPLVSGKTLLALAIERLLPLFPREQIWVITQARQADAVRRITSRYGRVRLLIEPAGRNTAPCIAYGASLASVEVGDASMVFLPADHVIGRAARFRSILKAGLDFVEREDALLAVGVKPTRPATGYGYIRRGAAASAGRGRFFRVRGFAEKPTEGVARRYLTSGEYLWNSGVFLFRASVVLEEIAAHLPGLAGCFGTFASRVGSRGEKADLARCYSRAEAISFDYGVMEKTRRAWVVSADIGWDDLGNWESFFRHVPKDARGNRVVGSHLGIDSRGCLVYAGKRLVGTIGIEDVVVVVTDDSVLLARRGEAERVKELAALVAKRGFGALL